MKNNDDILTAEPNVKIYLLGRPLISATKYERPVLRCSDCFGRYAVDLPEGVKEKEKFDLIVFI